MPVRSRARSSWRWTSSRAATCARCGTAARRKAIAFPVDVAAYIVKELARGLHYAHGFGDIKLVHRDVSPPNVLLSYSGEVKLTDFGLASSTLKLEKTAPGIIYGKVSYMSPEQARGETLDGRTDLYASGIILWELLTGRQLFPSAKAPGAQGRADVRGASAARPQSRADAALAPRRRVPAELDRIALKALAPDLKQRYANCEELRHDLATYLAQASPATDATRVAAFLADLYGDDIVAERTERDGPDCAGPRMVFVLDSPPGRRSRQERSRRRFRTAAVTAGRKERAESRPALDAANGATLVAGPAPHDRDVEQAPDRLGGELAPVIRIRASSASAAVVGTVIGGRYYVRRLCGEGGMGRVYEAEHIDIGKRVALKILHPAFSQTPDLVERLRREARAASKISHPNVVDVTDSGTTPDGAFFFVMEYLEGIELGELIYREGKLDVRRALHIGTQICRALQAAHDVNVIHRDLKPENVLILTRDGQKDFVKVLDFGIAKSGSDSDLENESKGRAAAHPARHDDGDAGIHGARAGRGPSRRSALRHLRGRRAALRDALRQAPVRGDELHGDPAQEGEQPAGAAVGACATTCRSRSQTIITRSMAKEPDGRPQSMEELGRELQALAIGMYPGFGTAAGAGEHSEMIPVGVLGAALRNAAVSTELLRRFRGMDRWKVVTGAGLFAGLALAFVFVGITGASKQAPPPPVVQAVAPAPPPVAPAPPVRGQGRGAAPPATEETAVAEEAEERKRHKRRTRRPPRRRRPRAPRPRPPGESRLRRRPPTTRSCWPTANACCAPTDFAEAREIFEKLAKSKRERGPALVGLAEISFQEKKYAEAARSAALAADRGGGVKARVLLGDAHFRLAQFKEAARAYEEALKIDPSNASAKSGLALATKRM